MFWGNLWLWILQSIWPFIWVRGFLYGWIESKLMCGEKDHDRGYEIGGEKCVSEVVLLLLIGLVGGKRGLSSLTMMVILGEMETICP